METPEYAQMDAAEDHLWWYGALHAYLLDALEASPLASSAPTLDAGCGTGGFLRRLGAGGRVRDCIGLERLPSAAARAREKSGAPIAIGTVNALPFASSSFGTIVSADVLYHRDVDPGVAAREALRCLRPGGAFVVNVPAFQWLSSYHDRRVHGARRFNRPELAGLLAEAGFERIAIRFWNSLLFPVMVARRLRPGSGDAASDVERLNPAVNALLRTIVGFERKLIRCGLRFPVGGSLLAIAYKP